jgi:hypothetical protein
MSFDKRPLKVFLCHASADKLAVRDLYKRLTADGVDAWLDVESLIPGQNWQVEIPKAIRASDVVIVCLSEKSVNKEGYVQKEIKFALDIADEKPEGTIFVVPARLEGCEVPDRLSMYHWVDLFEENGYEMLMRALRARADKIGATVSLQPRVSDLTKKICENIFLTYQDMPSRSRSHGLRIMMENKNPQPILCRAFLINAFLPEESINKYLLSNNFYWIDDSLNLVIERKINRNRVGTFLLADINKDDANDEYLYFVMQEKINNYVKRFRKWGEYKVLCEVQGTMNGVEFTCPVIDLTFEVSPNFENKRYIRTTQANIPKGK